MVVIVKLKAMFTGRGGGTSYKGEMIGVDEDTAKNLIRSGSAVAVNREKIVRNRITIEPPRATKPVIDAPELRGFAKLKWFRDQIREFNKEPKGRTIVELSSQLEELRK